VRYAIATTITFVVGAIMGYHQIVDHIGWTVAAGLLVIVVSWSLSWIFALFGMLARTAGSVQGISFLVLFPLTFLSNAFVGTTTLPAPLKAFAEFNPVSHLITAVRTLVNDQQVTGDVWLSLLGAAVVVAVFAPLTVRAYMRKA
jgi:ABC-2 type transport system permease protein